MIKKLEGSKIEFKASVFWQDWEKYLDVAAAETSHEIKIEGFRPGKAPRKIVEQKVGIEILINKAAQKAVEKSYTDLVMAEKLNIIGRPEITIEEIKEKQDLRYKVVAAIMPEIEIGEKYKKEIKKINAEHKEKSAEVSEDELQLELEKLAASRVKLVTVRREAQSGDSAEIDFKVLIDGKPIKGGESLNHPLIIGKGVFIPGFEENIIGLKEGEEKEFELAFPPDYHKKDLAAKKAVFQVKMKLVQARETPEVNDDFAKSLGKFENLEGLKKSVRHGMEGENRQKMKEKKRAEFIERILDHSKVDLPEVLVRGEINQMMQEFEQQLSMMGMNLEQYLSRINKEKTELEKDWEPQAQKRVKSAMALEKIAKMENISAESEEIEAEMNKTLQYYKNVKDLEKNIDMQRLYNYAKGNLENEKVFGYLESL